MLPFAHELSILHTRLHVFRARMKTIDYMPAAACLPAVTVLHVVFIFDYYYYYYVYTIPKTNCLVINNACVRYERNSVFKHMNMNMNTS